MLVLGVGMEMGASTLNLKCLKYLIACLGVERLLSCNVLIMVYVLMF